MKRLIKWVTAVVMAALPFESTMAGMPGGVSASGMPGGNGHFGPTLAEAADGASGAEEPWAIPGQTVLAGDETGSKMSVDRQRAAASGKVLAKGAMTTLQPVSGKSKAQMAYENTTVYGEWEHYDYACIDEMYASLKDVEEYISVTPSYIPKGNVEVQKRVSVDNSEVFQLKFVNALENGDLILDYGVRAINGWTFNDQETNIKNT